MARRAFDYSHLSPEERLQLVEDLWNSLALGTPKSVPVPESHARESHARELDRRLAGERGPRPPLARILEERLDPERFLRVHRSVIVRRALVEALHKGAGGEYEVQLKGSGRLRVSRSRREALERWLGVWS
ncbi:hypothetical protein tb265_03980 [Gemmatimonadetes bacterium T265]|nr:hypothetical protein tb265_03980 [Gemmatimonadetes bacterium T265]